MGYGYPFSLESFTRIAAIRLESNPPDNKQPMRRLDIILFSTACVNKLRMLACTISSVKP